MATTRNSAALSDWSLSQTQLVSKDLAATRSPSLESFEWFKDYVNYSESTNSSPATSGNPLMQMLLRFQKVLDNYENERVYESFVEGLDVRYLCIACKMAYTIIQLHIRLGNEDEKMTPMMIENWAQATVGKAIRSKELLDGHMPNLGEAVGQLCVTLGRLWEAKLYLEQAILEMKRLNFPLVLKRKATLSLAVCYSEMGNIQQANYLLKIMFKTEYAKIVASSHLFLERYCRECDIRLLKECYSKAKNELFQDTNDAVGYEWEIVANPRLLG